MANIIIGDEWGQEFCNKFGIDSSKVARIVIDCVPGEPLHIYVSMVGTEELLDVRPPEANEAEVIIVGE